MKRSWPVHAFVALWLFFVSVQAPCQSEDLALTGADVGVGDIEAAAALAANAYLPDDSEIPPELLGAMRNARQKYLEGSNFIKVGESEKARAAFNQAVDLLLQSDWDLTSTPILKSFFQDLIQRIQQDESLYLKPPDETADKPEQAVVDTLEKIDLIPITIDPSLQDIVEQDLANTKYDIPIMLNERVLKSLNFWLNRGRKFFVSGLMRSGRYRDMIGRIFKEESIPFDIMYLAQVESLFKPNALSRAQAKGIWQFGKWTAIRYGLKVNSYVDERCDPEKSTRAAARYLNDLYGMFKDWNLVLAAYNWGEARIQRLIEKSGLNDFWELADSRRKIPEETKNHVPLIMASIILGRNPEKYGLPKKLDQPIVYDSIGISRAVDLRAAAKILNMPVDDLKELNPSLRGYATPANYPEFQLKVPVGTDSELGQKIASLPAVKFKPQPELAARHKVQRGESLEKIAARYGVSPAALQKANNISRPSALLAGTWIRVPSRFTSAGKPVAKTKPAGKLAAAKQTRTAVKARSKPKNAKSAPVRSQSKLPAHASAGGSNAKSKAGTRSVASKSRSSKPARIAPKAMASQ
jgi:membrane-bound lytic murein transglycosylase D